MPTSLTSYCRGTYPSHFRSQSLPVIKTDFVETPFIFIVVYNIDSSGQKPKPLSIMYDLQGSCLSKRRCLGPLKTSGDIEEFSLPPKKRKTVSLSVGLDVEIDQKKTNPDSPSSFSCNSDDQEQVLLCSSGSSSVGSNDSEDLKPSSSSSLVPLVTCLRTRTSQDETRKRRSVHFADDVKLFPSAGTCKRKKVRRVDKKRKNSKKHIPVKKDEEVQVIVFHTGILYVHKGIRPWVEFVRKR